MTYDALVETRCPVCGRDVLVHEDGALWHHFTSWMNQDDSSQPMCIGGGIRVTPPLDEVRRTLKSEGECQ